MKKFFVLNRILFISLLVYSTQNMKSQTNFVWGRQFGSDKEEAALNVVTDHVGNVYVAGYTQGNLSGNAYGKSDGFLAKLDTMGNILWTKQFGSTENDGINWLTIDAKGNLYLTGGTDGVVDGQSYGKTDVWVVKFDSAGTLQWQRQYGSDSVDVGYGIYVSETGDIFVSGATKGRFGASSFGKADCFILKLDNNGKKIFIRQFGTSEDEKCEGITEDPASNLYVCGGTYGNLSGNNKGKTDAFVGCFTDKGEQIKFIQFGTESNDMAHIVKFDKQGNIYVGGSTGGNLAAKQLGEGDCFLMKMTKSGEIVWIKQFGTEKWDGILGIDIDDNASGNIVVSGCQHWPACQSFIRMFTKDGDLLWIRNSVATGKNGGTCGKGVCIDKKGNVYHTGLTGGNLFSPVQGQHDIFVVKYELDKSQAKP